MRLPAAALLAGLVGWGGASGSAHAATTHRVAILVAHPQGGPETERLRYPHVDALKFGAVLNELGGFSSDDLTLLLSPRPAEIRDALAAAGTRLRAAHAEGAHTLLVFYYSGHAAGGSLQLGDERLEMAELRDALRDSGAAVQLAFLDACESGAMTRLKGGQRAPSFVVDVDGDRAASGYVVITSSSAHESSQESDELRGSFFTHHLVSGLRGAADQTGDGTVNLEEAYAYAYHRTVAQTAGTRGGTQHPTFTYDLRGNGEVTLTRLGGRGALVFPAGAEGRNLVYDRGRDRVVGEVDPAPGRPTRLSVAPGRYVIKRRAADHLLLQDVEVRADEQRVIDEAGFSAVAFEEDVTKGPAWLGAQRRVRSAWSLGGRLGYQAFFDAPSRDELFHPSPLVGVHAEARNLLTAGLSVHLDAAFGATESLAQTEPYGDQLAVDFKVVLTSVGLSLDAWPVDTLRLRAGPHLTAVYLRRDFRALDRGDPPPFQDLFTVSPGLAVGGDWFAAGAFSLGLTLRAHYLRYATEVEDRSLGFGEAYLTLGYAP